MLALKDVSRPRLKPGSSGGGCFLLLSVSLQQQLLSSSVWQIWQLETIFIKHFWYWILIPSQCMSRRDLFCENDSTIYRGNVKIVFKK